MDAEEIMRLADRYSSDYHDDIVRDAASAHWIKLAVVHLEDSRAKFRAAVEAMTRERDEARDFIDRQGYRRCDIAACNCGSWHGGHLRARFDEIREALEDADVNLNGVTMLAAVQNVLAAQRAGVPMALERDRLWCQALAETADVDSIHRVTTRFNELRPDAAERSAT